MRRPVEAMEIKPGSKWVRTAKHLMGILFLLNLIPVQALSETGCEPIRTCVPGGGCSCQTLSDALGIGSPGPCWETCRAMSGKEQMWMMRSVVGCGGMKAIEVTPRTINLPGCLNKLPNGTCGWIGSSQPEFCHIFYFEKTECGIAFANSWPTWDLDFRVGSRCEPPLIGDQRTYEVYTIQGCETHLPSQLRPKPPVAVRPPKPTWWKPSTWRPWRPGWWRPSNWGRPGFAPTRPTASGAMAGTANGCVLVVSECLALHPEAEIWSRECGEMADAICGDGTSASFNEGMDMANQECERICPLFYIYNSAMAMCHQGLKECLSQPCPLGWLANDRGMAGYGGGAVRLRPPDSDDDF